MMPLGLAWGFASFFCLGMLLVGDFRFAAVLFLVATVSLIGFLAVLRHFTRRLERVVHRP